VRYFLAKTTVEPGSMLEIAGTPVLARYDVLAQHLENVADPASIGVLAEPLLSYGNDVASATVVWYSPYPGEAQRLADLPPERQEALQAILRARLVDLANGLSDADFGPTVGAALNMLDPRDVFEVDRQPVIVGWGMVPPEAGVSAAARNRHFARSMGRYLPLAEAPPTTPEEWRSRRMARPPEPSAIPGAAADAAAAATAATAAAAAQTAAGGAAPPSDAPPERKQRGAGWRWLPLGLLLLLSGLALWWLLSPGTRVMPPAPPVAFPAADDRLRIAREANDVLEARAAELEAAVAGAYCTPQGDLVLPDGRTPEGLLPVLEGEGDTDGPRIGEARPDALLPAAPRRVEAPAEAHAGEDEDAIGNPATLFDLIDRRTALVLAGGPANARVGSGFFIGPDLLVTNHHIVAGVESQGRVHVVNESLGRAREAQVLNRLGPLEEAGGDFALLRVPQASSPFFTLWESTETLRLQNVVAAGYPGAVLDTDVNFARLMAGDLGSIPALNVTDGIVNVEQNLGPATRVIVHTAQITTGNSGGPLVDACGRVVGVNTFGRADASTNRFLNFALASADLLRFLEDTVAEPERSAGPCTPRVQAAAPPPPRAPAAGAEAGNPTSTVPPSQ